MAIKVKPSYEDMMLFEILRHPVLCPEFIYNIDLVDGIDDPFEFSYYQKEILCDFNDHVSICTARATGKTVSLSSMIIWMLIFKVFPDDYILYAVPSKVHLEPVFTNLVRQFRSNSFLKNFLDRGSGINSSDYKITLLNQSSLLCRIAGQSGTGANLIGLHTPIILTDECVTGNQYIRGSNNVTLARDVSVGDEVLSWDGNIVELDRVSAVEKKKVDQKVLDIKHASGSIHVGEHHRVYTDNGYVEAGSLGIGDKIYILNDYSRSSIQSDIVDRIYELVLEGKTLDFISKVVGRTENSIRHIIDREFGGVRDIKDADLSDEQKQVILGSLLGDSSCDNRGIKRACISTNHSIKQREYVDWLIGKLGYLVRRKARITQNGGWGTLNYAVGTLYHKWIKEISQYLYTNNKKTITREYLNKLGTLGLAVWFMDDGSYLGSLSTHGFSYEENILIRDYLLEVWGIDSVVRKDNRKNLYYIFIRSIKKFRELIRKHIPNCMMYKIDNSFTPPALDIEEHITIINENPRQNLIPVYITSIDRLRTTPKYLYQITVEKNHNFFCNNVLVKNCGYFPLSAFQEMQPSLNVWTYGYREVVAGVPTGLREGNVLYMADYENDSYTKHRVAAHKNPRVTPEDIERFRVQYGGEDSDDFIHYVLGLHGKPVFALFDRNLLKIEQYPVIKLDLDGIKLSDNLDDMITRLVAFPSIKNKEYGVLMGIDLGYTEPTAIVIAYIDSNDRIKFHGRIKLSKVSYPIQEKIIDLLDTKFNPQIIGMDEGNAGKSVRQHLTMDKEYAKKSYNKRLVCVDFSSSVVIGINSDGTEIKSKTKPFTVSVLQDYSNSHKIIYSSTDLDMVSELERMTYSKSVNGDIAYRTLTDRGGKKGEDHFTSALLCCVGAYHLTNGMVFTREKKNLMRPNWIY